MNREGMRVWKSWKGRRTKNGNHANGDKIAEREKSTKDRSSKIMKFIF